MKKPILILGCVLTTFLVIAACKKQLNPDQNEITENRVSTNQLVSPSKSFFISTVLKSEAETKTLPKTTLSKSKEATNLPLDRMTKLSKDINWDGGFKLNIGESGFVFVPINESIKPFLNKEFEFVRYLVFEPKASGIFNLSVIELLGDKGTSLKSPKQMAMSAFKNIQLNVANPLPDLNASIILYNQKYERLKSYHVSNGKWEIKRISFRSDLEIKL